MELRMLRMWKCLVLVWSLLDVVVRVLLQLVWRLRHVDLGGALGAHLDHGLWCEAVSPP